MHTYLRVQDAAAALADFVAFFQDMVMFNKHTCNQASHTQLQSTALNAPA
jgi:hypothetical protein